MCSHAWLKEIARGSTDFGSALALCYDQLSKPPALVNPTEGQKSAKFCVLTTDGVPDYDSNSLTDEMRSFCSTMGIPILAATSSPTMQPTMAPTVNYSNVSTLTPTSAPTVMPTFQKWGVAHACTARNIAYSIKQAGCAAPPISQRLCPHLPWAPNLGCRYIIITILVKSDCELDLTGQKCQKAEKAAKEFASCEYRPVCPVTCGQCMASEDQCVDDEELLKVRSTNLIDPCAAAKTAGLCDTAGTTSTINNNYTNGTSLTIDIGKWSFGYSDARVKPYKPAITFNKTKDGNASNYDGGNSLRPRLLFSCAVVKSKLGCRSLPLLRRPFGFC